jgi:murein endopeptidase
MACLEHGNRPPCHLQHSEPKPDNTKRSLSWWLKRPEWQNYITKDQQDYKSIKAEQLKLKCI